MSVKISKVFQYFPEPLFCMPSYSQDISNVRAGHFWVQVQKWDLFWSGGRGGVLDMGHTVFRETQSEW